MFLSFNPDDPLATFTYANNGLVSRRTEGSGASSASYGWDDINRLTSQSDVFSGGTNNVAWTFAYNPASQIVTETRSNDSYGFAKTAASATYAVNGLNQYTAVGGTAQTYDANGNLTGTGSAAYTYDIENRLVKAVAGATTNLVYDPLGRLFEVNQGTSATTTRLLNDGDSMVLEFSSQNDVTNRFVHGSNAAADDPLVWYSGANLTSKRWLHADHLGSIVAWTNSSGGSPTINRYDEYGLPAATNSGRFQYTGQAWIGELGLYYYKARFYSPGLGRFMQTDPVGYDDQINLYAYVGNDPVNVVDPLGTEAEDQQPKPTTCGSRVGVSVQCIGIDMLALVATIGASTEKPETADQRQSEGTQKVGPHYYDIFIPLCHACSPSDAFQAMRFFSAPGAPYAEEGTRDITLPSGDPIRQKVDVRAMRITNVALPGHRFGGKVEILLARRGDFIGARVIGSGIGPNPRANQVFGPITFRVLGFFAYSMLNPYVKRGPPY